MRFLVLGGTAFIGPPLVRQLVQAGHDVAVFHRGRTTTQLPTGVTVFRGDRHRLGEHVAQLRAFRADVVIDMICFNRHDAADLIHTFAGHVGRAVVASSADVYRAFAGLIRIESFEPDLAPLTESSPLRARRYPFRAQSKTPTDPMYDYDKIDVESELATGALPACVLRLPMVFGPHDRQRRLSPYLRLIRAGKPIVLSHTHAAWRTARGYVENMARAMAMAALAPSSAGKTYNIADATVLPEAEFAREVCRAAGAEPRVEIVPEDQVPREQAFPGDPAHWLELDTSLFRRDFGYTDAVPLTEALARTVEWELATLPPE